MDVRFELGNSLIICGPSKAGKTSWVLKLIRHQDILFKEPINKIYWFYSVWQPSYNELKFMGVILKDEVGENFNDIQSSSLVVLDDLVKETENSASVTSLFTQ